VQKADNRVKKCVEEYGFFGVKLSGSRNDFFVDGERAGESENYGGEYSGAAGACG